MIHKVTFMMDGSSMEILPIDLPFLIQNLEAQTRYNSEPPKSLKNGFSLDWFGDKDSFHERYVKHFPSQQFRYKMDQKIEGLLKE